MENIQNKKFLNLDVKTSQTIKYYCAKCGAELDCNEDYSYEYDSYQSFCKSCRKLKEDDTMSKPRFKIIFEDEEQDEVFDSEEAAEEYALYLCSCSREGTEILHMSNPGDYDYDEDGWESPEYEIIEVDD